MRVVFGISLGIFGHSWKPSSQGQIEILGAILTSIALGEPSGCDSHKLRDQGAMGHILFTFFGMTLLERNVTCCAQKGSFNGAYGL